MSQEQICLAHLFWHKDFCLHGFHPTKNERFGVFSPMKLIVFRDSCLWMSAVAKNNSFLQKRTEGKQRRDRCRTNWTFISFVRLLQHFKGEI